MPKPKGYWTNERIFSGIRKLHAEGVEMNYKGVCHADISLYNAIAKYCGGLRKAIEAAGLEYNAGNPPWTRERVVAMLQQLHADGVVIRYSEIQAVNPVLGAMGSRLFGTTDRAIRAAGLIPYRNRKAPLATVPRRFVINEPIPLRSMRQNPFGVAADLQRKNNGVVLNRIVSLLGMSEAQRTAQG